MAVSLGNLYNGFAPNAHSNGVAMPPVGSYVAYIQAMKVEPNPWDTSRNDLVLRLEIAEGEYKGIFRKIYESQKEKFDNPYFKGDIRISIPNESSTDKQKGAFERSLGCLQESAGIPLDPQHMEAFVGKNVGITIREREYIDKKTSEVKVLREVAYLETVADVTTVDENGKNLVWDGHLKRYELQNKPKTDASSGFQQVETDECPF